MLPVGTILPYTGSLSDIPKNWSLCDGTNGTPDLRNQFLMGWGNKSVKTFIQAGLPNITGTYRIRTGFQGQLDSYLIIDGAFQAEQPYISSGTTGYGSLSLNGGFNLDASRSSQIYGRSNTVQPPAYTVYYIMKIK